MNSKTLSEEKIDFPWIIFKLGTGQYAINSKTISCILTMPEQISQLPEVPSYVRGLFKLRGDNIPLIELRQLFNLPSVEDQYQVFVDMLEHRKQDHLNWVQALKESIEYGIPFPLATDPHKCAFGKWYDQYRNSDGAINHTLQQINEPHQRLHQTAIQIQQCLQISDFEQQTACNTGIFLTLDSDILPTIVRLLDETKEIMKRSFQEMVLVMITEQGYTGIIVDEVLAVEPLTLLTGQDNLFRFQELSYICGVSKNEQGLILLIDDEQLLQQVLM